MLHIPLIHVVAIAVSILRTGAVTPWLFGNHPLEPPEPPDGYRWSLTLLYLVTAICVGVLYVACRWYAERQARIEAAFRRPVSYFRLPLRLRSPRCSSATRRASAFDKPFMALARLGVTVLSVMPDRYAENTTGWM